MPKKGICNNLNGRPKGVPNKANRSLRLIINDFLNKNFELIQSDFKELSARDRVRLYVDLLQFSLPRLQAINLSESELGLDIADLSPEAIETLTRQIKSTMPPQIKVNIIERTNTN